MKIDWESEETVICRNPRCLQLGDSVEKLSRKEGLVWISSSGTTQAPRWIGLSRQAIFHAARSVNAYLQSHRGDVWLNALPDFHIAGVAIEARAWLSGAQVLRVGAVGRGSWNPQEWIDRASQCTLSALVPTQVYDIVQIGAPAPPSMRAIIVGGGYLNEKLYRQARHLGWPLLPSYGMTECASQIATASLDSLERNDFPPMRILEHVSVRTDANDILHLRSEALYSACIADGKWELRQGGEYRTNDRGAVRGKDLQFYGREDAVVKIGGESVDLEALQRILENIQIQSDLKGECNLVAQEDPRKGRDLLLQLDKKAERSQDILLREYHKQTRPFERIDSVIILDSLSKTALGKNISLSKK